MFNHISYVDELLFCQQMWLEKNGDAGWDPYDIYGSPFGKLFTSGNSIVHKAGRYGLHLVDNFAPLLTRKILMITPQINAKGMGLFASSAILLNDFIAQQSSHKHYLNWLLDNAWKRKDRMGWGYPFDWQSKVFIEKGTPTVVNSAIIGDAFWRAYIATKQKSYLDVCESICRFIMQDLNRSAPNPDGSFCFSYTPIDNMEVHNANLFGAEFLIRIGSYLGEEQWVSTGTKAANFSINQIMNDGTLNYFSDDQALCMQQDTYHAGFEIRALAKIGTILQDKTITAAALKYFQAWKQDYFWGSGRPCFIRGVNDELEVHSLAESLICPAQMLELNLIERDEYLSIVQPIIENSLSELWKKTNGDGGYFMNNKNTKTGSFKDISYIRWGQAWMFFALTWTKTLLNEQKNEIV